MYYRRSRQFIKILLSQVAVGLLILVTGLSIVFYAQGYRFNWRNFKIIKTGVVYLSSLPKDSSVYVGRSLQKTKTPFSKNLTPGFYDLSVKKDGYTPWQLRLKVESGLVSGNKNIVLILQNIKTGPLTDQTKINLLHEPLDVLAVNAPDSLTYNSHEIWVGSTLIARLSTEIDSVIWYPDTEHIIYQSGAEIRMMEKTGTNDTLLVTLSKNTPAEIAVGNRGTELYYTDNGQYMIATIR